MRSAAFLIVALLAVPQKPDVRKAERFAAVLNAGPLATRPLAVDITIDRWGSDAVRQRLADIYLEDGQSGLVEAVKKLGAAAYVSLQNHERLVAGYVEEEPQPDGGRRILMLCVRYAGDWEFTQHGGWTDYPFRLLALTLDDKGRGSGTLFHAARVKFGSEGVDLVSELTGQPTKLLSVQKTR
jgi:hypothetical protein